MELVMLGTGNALATKCYNTCFLLRGGPEGPVLTDGGGGNGLLPRLEEAGCGWRDVREIIVTHRHIDHLLGIVWMMRLILQSSARGRYEGTARILAGEDVCGLLTSMARDLLPASDTEMLGRNLFLVPVRDGEEHTVGGMKTVFFDTGSSKIRQMGYRMTLPDGSVLTCLGDEPLHKCGERYAEGADLLLHEAFCLFDERDIYRPYEKHHVTAREAAQNAERVGAKALLLYHTEDTDLSHRRARYTAEAKAFFSGPVLVPDDGEVIALPARGDAADHRK